MDEEIKRKKDNIKIAIIIILVFGVIFTPLYFGMKNRNENIEKATSEKEQLCDSKQLQYDAGNNVCYLIQDDLVTTFGIIRIEGNYYIIVEVK